MNSDVIAQSIPQGDRPTSTAAAPPRALLSVRNVSRTFTTGSGNVEAVKDASFDIVDGSFTVVYGPSGSGKSTLLNCLIGLDKPTEGTVTYEGRDLYAMTPNERAFFRANTMGMVYQTNYWVKSLSVIENVALPLTFIGYSKENAMKGAHDSLVRVGMEQYAQKHPADLSGGEQQRVALARALVNNPSYIVADELTGNLDTQAGDSMINLLRYFNKTLLRTVILVTHNPVYLPVGDTLLTVVDGSVQAMTGDRSRQAINDVFADTTNRMERWKGMR